MSTKDDELLKELAQEEYKYGFTTDIEMEIAPKGLDEDTVRLISAKKNEPDWLLDWRLRAFRHFRTLKMPAWQNFENPEVDFQDISYYAAPKPKKQLASMDEVDPELLATFEKLGIPLDEQKVLAGVVDIANRAGHWAMAERHLRRGLALYPGDMVLRRYLAEALERQEQHIEAGQIRDQLVQEDADNPRHRIDRIKACMVRQQAAEALPDIEWLEQHRPETQGLDYYAAVVRGQTPKQQPEHMAQGIFESMADIFDQRLVRDLGYRLPKLVADHLVQRWPQKDFNLLDLGCGTGLLGVCLAPLQGYLIGVDISRNMLEQAAKHNIYYRFHNVNLRDALRETPAGEYEAIACLDAMPYLGDMQPLLPDAARILKGGGVFVFSCEQAPEDGPDLVLNPATQRYAHKKSHIEALCRNCALEPATQELTIRHEAGQPVAGFWIAASKAAENSAAKPRKPRKTSGGK